MYQPLHHKYRPQTFADLVGQEAIATTLTNAITHKWIAPAYLFTGPRGTGKTSSARIFAKSLNCLASEKPTVEPCGQCEVCQAIARGSALDVIEIDAASNNSVDNIREIIERSQFAPVQCRYKVYVIDEAHALSASATQALLKTLEEPPQRVVFILCTTEPQKLGDTIISRCQRFNFRGIDADCLTAHLKIIAEQESIAITDEAVRLIVNHSNGGVRDTQTLLDQLRLLGEEITPLMIHELIGTVPEQALLQLVKAIAGQKPDAVLTEIRRIFESGKDPLIILQNLLAFYTNLLIAQTSEQAELSTVSPSTWEAIKTLDFPGDIILQQQEHLRSCETQIKFSRQPRLMLEVALFGLIKPQIKQPKESSEVPESTPKIKSVSLNPNEVWDKVIGLQKPALKALLSQQANLLLLNENEAKIKVATAFKPRVEKAITDLEIAFQKVAKSSVKVSLI